METAVMFFDCNLDTSPDSIKDYVERPSSMITNAKYLMLTFIYNDVAIALDLFIGRLENF
jgi:hypothetical protein